MLAEELEGRWTLVEGNPVSDKAFLGSRVTLLLGLMGVLGLWRIPSGEDLPNIEFIRKFCAAHQKESQLWGESGFPCLLAYLWFSRKHDATAAVDFAFRDLIALVTRHNHPDSTSPLANPYYECVEIPPFLLGFAEEPPQETFRGRSYMLEGLVHLFVRRNWKQAMKGLWPDVTRIGFARFYPNDVAGFFRWRCAEGINRTVYPTPTQLWDELVSQASEAAGNCVPDLAREFPHFVLLYLIVCAHRANSEVLRWLDTVLVGGV